MNLNEARSVLAQWASNRAAKVDFNRKLIDIAEDLSMHLIGPSEFLERVHDAEEAFKKAERIVDDMELEQAIIAVLKGV